MKNFILLFLILFGLDSFSQNDAPCFQRKNGNRKDPYTQSEIKLIFKKTSAPVSKIRSEISKNINLVAIRAGKSWRVNESDSSIDFILDHTVYIDKAKYSDQILNGHQNGGGIYYDTTRKTDGYYGVFQYDGVEVRCFDPNCLNPQKEIYSYSRIGRQLDETSATGLQSGDVAQPSSKVQVPGLKHFTRPNIIQPMTTTAETRKPYIPPLREKRQLSNFGKFAIGFLSAAFLVGLGWLAWEIWKPKHSDNITPTNHGIDPGPGSSGNDPPPGLPRVQPPQTFGFGYAIHF